MSRNHHSLVQLAVSATLVLTASGAALADDNSMSRFGGESYAYFNRMLSNASASPAWRQDHPNGLTERELQALSASDLSAFALPSQLPVVTRIAADPTWRQSHRTGLTVQELQAFSSSPISRWSIASQAQAPAVASGAPPSAQPLRAASDARKTYE